MKAQSTPGWLSVLRVALFLLIIAFCWWLADQTFSPLEIFLGVVVAPGLVVPVVWAGRRLLDIDPTPDRAAWVTTLVHYTIGFLLATGIAVAIITAEQWRGWQIPLAPWIGRGLAIVTGIFTMLTVVNLAVRGLGAPFAIALSKRVATDWLYAWTRNPMVLGTLLCAVSLGLWYQSALFVLWAGLWLTFVWVAFLKIYEERELEIRLGKSYLEYKARTPFLWPRRPLKVDR